MKNKKYIFLVALIFVVLATLSIYSTFAYDISQEEGIDSSSDLAYSFDIKNNISKEVKINANTTKNVDIVLTNSNESAISYGLAYSMVNPTEIPEGVFVYQSYNSKDTSQGSIEQGGERSVIITVENSSTTDVVIKLAVVTGYAKGGSLSDRLETGQTFITELDRTSERINTNLDNVRYIKDCVSGNTVNGGNHWTELKAFYKGENVALNKKVTANFTVGTTYGTGTLNTITDGLFGSEGYSDGGDGTGKCITVDLEEEYDLDRITVWHY